MPGTEIGRIKYVRNRNRKDQVCQEQNQEGSSMSGTELGRIKYDRNRIKKSSIPGTGFTRVKYSGPELG